jgi:VCBS repeat-containing protein
MKGKNWTVPTPIDNHEGLDDDDGRGHQIMPSLTFAGGALTATWYDTRNSPLDMFPQISGEEQTMDVRAAQANPSDSEGDLENPDFNNSVQVSRYLYYAVTDDGGNLIGENREPVDENNPPWIKQANPDHPNRPIFDGGSSPFMGDYLDSAPSPMFLRDYGTGEWRFNTGEGPFDPTLCHIVFASNRDVIPPDEDYGLTWASYAPPGKAGCLDDLTTGMRDQNVYTAPLTQGIQVYCPVNTKPLSLERRSFLVFVKNLTDEDKLIRLTIDALNLNASFWESVSPQEVEYPFERSENRIVEIHVFPHSSITLTVFVLPYDPTPHPLATFRVNVEEINGPFGDPTGLKNSVVLNPDPVNTRLIADDPRPVLEYDEPFVITEDLFSWVDVDFNDVTLFSDEYVFTDEVLAELLEASNPDVLAPSRRHPSRRHDAILNPSRRHSLVKNSGPEGGEITDINWTVENTGAVTAAYSFDLLGETPSVPYQLLIYRVSSTHLAECTLSPEEHHELLLSFEEAGPLSPSRRHTDLQNPSRRHNTFFLAPGETAICTLRLMDPKNPHPFDPDFYANTVTGAFIPQASNETGEIEVTAFMWIYTTALPDGTVNAPYVPEPYLEAEGGTGTINWSLVPDYDDLPPGLTLDSDGRIWGTPTPDGPYDNNEKTYYFAVQATDSTTPTAQDAYRSLSIKVKAPNQAPVAVNDAYGVDEDITLNTAVPGVLANDTDANGDQLTAIKVSDPANGSLSLNSDGSFIYYPNLDFFGTDTFTYKANDGQADSNIATVTITVNPVNDAPSFTPGSNVTVDEDSGDYLEPWATNMSHGPTYETNEDDQTLTFDVTNDDNSGLFAVHPSIDPTGKLAFRPAENKFGEATVTVILQDDGGTANGGADTSAEAEFVITIIAVPDPPIAVADEYTLEKWTQPQKGKKIDYVLDISAELGVLANDTDADGESLTAEMLTKPIRGGMTFRSDGSFRYRLNDEFLGDVTFTYEVSDSTGLTATATVTIHVVE